MIRNAWVVASLPSFVAQPRLNSRSECCRRPKRTTLNGLLIQPSFRLLHEHLWPSKVAYRHDDLITITTHVRVSFLDIKAGVFGCVLRRHCILFSQALQILLGLYAHDEMRAAFQIEPRRMFLLEILFDAARGKILSLRQTRVSPSNRRMNTLYKPSKVMIKIRPMRNGRFGLLHNTQSWLTASKSLCSSPLLTLHFFINPRHCGPGNFQNGFIGASYQKACNLHAGYRSNNSSGRNNAISSLQLRYCPLQLSLSLLLGPD